VAFELVVENETTEIDVEDLHAWDLVVEVLEPEVDEAP
jgi:hypothetical protein